MNKKVFTGFCGLAIAGMVSMTLVSCGGDDDDSGSYDADSLAIVTGDGEKLLVTSVGSVQFGYDSNGVLNYYYDGYDEYDVTDNGTTITYTSGGESETVKLTLNGNGYITKAVSEGSYVYSAGEESWKETVNLSYDGSGHLTKLSGSYSDSWTEDGEKETENGTGSWTLTWSGGLLTKWYLVETDEDYKWTSTYEYDYGSSTYLNAYCQYAPAVWDGADAILTDLSCIGLVGVGPTYLPASVSATEEYSDGDSDDWTNSYMFSFNSNGTINYQATATGKYKKSFTYEEYTGSSTRAFDVVTEDEEVDNADADTQSSRHLGLFGRRHRRLH